MPNMLKDRRDETITPAEIVWVDPPAVTTAGTGRNYRLDSFVEMLRAHPNQWARYPEFVTNGYSAGLAARYPGTEWVSRRPHPDTPLPAGRDRSDTSHLYGRFIG